MDVNNFKSPQQTHDLRSWAFYDLETKLTYKAHESGSEVLKVDASYTSQRCPRCGRILRENRDHRMHAYHCDKCGFTTNDDRVGAMNIWLLGMLWVSGSDSPTFNIQGKAPYSGVLFHGCCQPPDDAAAKGCIPCLPMEGGSFGITLVLPGPAASSDPSGS